MPVAAERDHVRMLQQQQVVGNEPLLALRHEPLLQFQRLAVTDAAELPHLAFTH